MNEGELKKKIYNKAQVMLESDYVDAQKYIEYEGEQSLLQNCGISLDDLKEILDETAKDFPKINEFGNFLYDNAEVQAIIWFKKYFGE